MRASRAFTLLATASGLGPVAVTSGLLPGTPLLLLTAGLLGLGSLAAHSEHWRESQAPAESREP